jgi:chromosome segregation ATPase
MPPRGTPAWRRQVILPLFTLLALAGGGIGAIAIANDPETSNFQHQISSLEGQLRSMRAELASVQASTANAATSRGVSRLRSTVRSLQSNVGSLKSSIVPLQGEVSALSACLPQLQQELAGVQLIKRGRAAQVYGVSAGCAGILGAR